MCVIKKFHNKYLIFAETIIVFALGIVHIVYGFLIDVTEFNPYSLFDYSPLFDFSLNSDCGDKTAIIFHRWGGRIEKITLYDENLNKKEEITIEDETDIKKINGNYFCYKHISYRDLLDNGQIIKNGTECPVEYIKNCGRIDNLEQELCIKDTEKCPLYDIGLGNPHDTDNYVFNERNSKVYYNIDGYNKPNKKIVGKLVLSQGLPCYDESDTLWRQFDSEEAKQTRLRCNLTIFGRSQDDRYEQKGSITYRQLYKDNLNQRSRDLVMDNIKGDEYVYLYKREFFGIDKVCDEKFNLNKENCDKFIDSERMDKTLLIVEGFLLGIPGFIFVFVELMLLCVGSYNVYDEDDADDVKCLYLLHCIFYSLFMTFLIVCFICQTVFYIRVINNDMTGFNCSDPITNEIIRLGTEDNEQQISYIKFNYYLDIFILGGNCLSLIIGLILIGIWNLISHFLQKDGKQNNEPSNHDNYINQKYNQTSSEVPLNTYYPKPT